MKWLIKQYMSQRQIASFAELARITGIGYQTLMAKLKDPRSFKVFELIALDKVLQFSNEDYMKLARGDGG